MQLKIHDNVVYFARVAFSKSFDIVVRLIQKYRPTANILSQNKIYT
nr:MAG TPA: hypothetical protein [Caudoviricetes sp.]